MFILDIFGSPTLGGHNFGTVVPIFYYNPFLERATSDLQAQIYASAHLLSFWTSSGHHKPFKIEPEVFVAKTIPKIHNNFMMLAD